MPIVSPSTETASNKEALRGSGIPIDTGSGFSTPKRTGNVNGFEPGEGQSTIAPGDEEWLDIARSCKGPAEDYLHRLKPKWEQALRAYNNQHISDSKYLLDRWRGRSKLHRPRTRTSVHKADAAAANALFSSPDIVATAAANPADPNQQASAAIIKELLSYRLDRTSGKAGLPWFQISVGAHNDARITGICVAKVYWDRQVVHKRVRGPEGQWVQDEASGKYLTQPSVKCDRPMVRLFPPELVWRDPAADWLNQVESSSFIGLLHPMSVGSAHQMLTSGGDKSMVRWRPLSKEILASCRTPNETQAVQNAREQNTNDRRDQRNAVLDFNTCWMIEWFVTRDGQEWHFWTAGLNYLASDPCPVEEAYPHLKGERPIVIGFGALEPHKIDPMSPVQTTLPLQQEMNDLVNLRLDGVKETIRPLTIVKRGQNIDVNSLQNRSGDTVVYAANPKEDVAFDRPGAIGGEAYMEMNSLNADFDDAAGQFNSGSVQTNRSLNETVGGMKLINSAANVVGDFDLRIWIETCIEPVLRQIVRLEQYYEDDAVILSIAGEKAKLYQKFRVNLIDDELMSREVLISVSAGIGTADPMVKLDKFAKAAGIAGTVLGQTIQQRLKQDPIMDEIFGAAGFKNASEAFLHPGDQTDQRIVQMQQMLQAMQAELEDKQADRDNKIQDTRLKGAIDIVKQLLQNAQAQQNAQIQHENDMEAQEGSQAHDMRKTLVAGAQRGQENREKGKMAIEARKVGTSPGGKPSAPAPTADDKALPPEILDRLVMVLASQLMGPQVPGAVAPQQPPMPAPQPQQAGGDPALLQMAQAQQQQSMAMMSMMQQMAQGMAVLAKSMQDMGAAQLMPKRVIRDPNTGKAIGFAPMIEGMAGPPMAQPPMQ